MPEFKQYKVNPVIADVDVDVGEDAGLTEGETGAERDTGEDLPDVEDDPDAPPEPPPIPPMPPKPAKGGMGLVLGLAAVGALLYFTRK